MEAIGSSSENAKVCVSCHNPSSGAHFCKKCFEPQVPDVSWNAPFKNSIRELHSDWMLHGDKPTTSGGNLRAPPMEIYLEWIVSAWEALSKDVIVKSFLCCGITKEDDEKNDALIHVFKKNGAIPNGLALLQQRRHEENMIKLVEEIDLNEDDNLGSDFSIEL